MSLKNIFIKSRSDFFKQDYQVLMAYKNQMISVLEIRNFQPQEIEFFIQAFDYFVVNPEQYDGATGSQDLYDLVGLEISPVAHDYEYIAKNCSGSLKYTRISDKILFHNMSRMGKSGFEITRRKILLWMKSYIVFYHLWSGRKMTKDDQTYMDLKSRIILKK